MRNDWPHWRGPAASGIAAPSPLPAAWSVDENVAWEAPLAGAGVSSPIVSGNRVFVSSQAGDGRRRDGRHPTLTQGGDPASQGETTLQRRAERADVAFILEAFDRSSGKRLWIHETAPEGDLPPVHDKHNLSSASPVTDGERVYAWYGTGQLVAVDAGGKRVWSKHLGKEYGPFDIQWGHSSSPVLFQDSIILLCYHSPSSYLLALDKRTGAVKWKVDKAPGIESYSSPIVAAAPTGNELIVNSSVGVESFDPATGKSLWTYPEVNRFPIPVSMVDGGMLYLSRGYRSSPYMAIRLGGRGDITNTHVAWRVPDRRPVRVVAGALPGRDLHEHRQRHPVGRGCDQRRAPVAGARRRHVQCVADRRRREGLLRERRRRDDRDQGRPHVTSSSSRNKLNGHFVASPAAGGGKVFLRADDRLFAVGR